MLNIWRFRSLTLLETSLIINVLACSNIWYVGSVLFVSKYYINKFQNSKVEMLSRNNMYLDISDKSRGG